MEAVEERRRGGGEGGRSGGQDVTRAALAAVARTGLCVIDSERRGGEVEHTKYSVVNARGVGREERGRG